MSADVAADAAVGADAGRRSDLREVWRIIKPRRGRGLLSLLLASLSLICAIGLIATSAWLISRAWQQPPILYLTVAVVAVRAFGLGRGVFRYTERLVSHSAALRGLTDLRVRLVERVAVVAPAGMRGVRRGDALRRLVDDVDASAEFGLRTVLPGATAVVVGAAVVGLVCWLIPLGGLVLLAGLLLAGVVSPWVTARVGRAAAGEQVHLKGSLAADLTSLLGQSADVIAAGAVSARMQRVRELDSQLLVAESQTARGMGVAAAIGAAAQGLALIGIVLVAVPAVQSGQLNGVNLAVVVLIPLVAFEIVAGLPSAALWLAKAQASSQRIVDLLDRPDPVPDPVDVEVLADVGDGDAVGRQRGVPPDLAVADVSVTWPGSEQAAVSGVSFRLQPGQRIGVVGPSGCGKSSLAAGLVKFAPITGSVRLGGVDYTRLSGSEVRRIVGYCEQDAHIFDNTVAENVRFARQGASDDEVVDVLRRVKLWDWVSSLPRGIQTQVGEHGAQLSGGQRQRVALARIVLADPPIAIFDEPTEHLDAVTAEALADDILDVMRGRSVIYLTHNPYGLDKVDAVLDLGALVPG